MRNPIFIQIFNCFLYEDNLHRTATNKWIPNLPIKPIVFETRNIALHDGSSRRFEDEIESIVAVDVSRHDRNKYEIRTI